MSYKKSEATRKKILDAARARFADKGYYATDLKEIAAGAGMAHTGVYYYFKRKQDIAEAIYAEETGAIIEEVERVRKEETCDPLFLCILQYVMIVRRLAMDPVTEACFFDMINYRGYDRDEMKRVRNSYYAALDELFKSRGMDMTDDEMTIYILTSDAYAKALLAAIKSGVIEYSVEEALDHFFRHLLLPDLGISFVEYTECRDRVIKYLDERKTI